MKIALALAVLAALSPSCKKEDAKERSTKKAAAKDFWPDAPQVTGTTGSIKLAYKPENITGYKLAIDVASLPGADVTLSAKMSLGLAFGPADGPRQRVARLTALDFNVNAAGQAMTMKLDNDSVEISDGSGPPVKLKRGEAGPISVEDLVDKPFTTLTFTDDNKITALGNPEHLFTDAGGDFLDTALVLFPDLPTQEISPGYKWTIGRDVPLGNNLGRVAVNYQFEYVGTSKCPSGSATCAQFAFTAASDNATAVTQGVTVNVTYGFAGKVFFDTARGAIDESRIRMDMDVKADKYRLPMGGTYTLKPT